MVFHKYKCENNSLCISASDKNKAHGNLKPPKRLESLKIFPEVDCFEIGVVNQLLTVVTIQNPTRKILLVCTRPNSPLTFYFELLWRMSWCHMIVTRPVRPIRLILGFLALYEACDFSLSLFGHTDETIRTQLSSSVIHRYILLCCVMYRGPFGKEHLVNMNN